jgi:hypothetical protein
MQPSGDDYDLTWHNGAPRVLPIVSAEGPYCGITYTDWQAVTWTCWLPPGHLGDHYSLDHQSWCWYSDKATP